MFTDVIYTNITYFKLQVSVPLSLIYHLWSYYNNSAIYNANKSLLLPLFIRKGNLIFFIFLIVLICLYSVKFRKWLEKLSHLRNLIILLFLFLSFRLLDESMTEGIKEFFEVFNLLAKFMTYVGIGYKHAAV